MFKLDKRGEAHIDTIASVFIIIMCLFISISAFLFSFQYSRLDEYADNIAQYAEQRGYIGNRAAADSDLLDYAKKTAADYGLNYAKIDFDISAASSDVSLINGIVPYGTALDCSVTYNTVFYNINGNDAFQMKVHKVGNSQAYAVMYTPDSPD